MANSLQNQCWALAGIAQAAVCVQSVASGKSLNDEATVALYKALLEQDPDSISAIAGLGDFSLGLSTAAGMLHRPNEERIATLRYTLAIMDATVKLRKTEQTVTRLAESVSELDREELSLPNFSSFDLPWDQLADIYVDTLGTLSERIQVRGDPVVLKRPEVASKVRGLLLMGVRFAWLWHQLGGRRWHLLVNRRRMWQTTQLLTRLVNEPPNKSGNPGDPP